MLADIKKLLGITSTTFDSIITNYIAMAKKDLEMVGIVSSTILESDPLIYGAIVSYCMGNLDNLHAELYLQSYELQKDALRHYQSYTEED